MPSLAEVRAQHPEYADLSDQQLADGLHRKFYADMPRADFDRKIGLKPERGPQLVGDKRAPYGVAGLVAGRDKAPRRGVFDEVSGLMAHLNRGVGLLDEVGAGIGTVYDVATGRVPLPGPGVSAMEVGKAFKANLAKVRGVEDDFATRRPNVAALARGTGMGGSLFIPGGPVTQTMAQGSRLGNAARGAVTAGATAAAYAAADRGTPNERIAAAAQAARNPVVLGLGAVTGGLVKPAARPAARPAPQPKARTPQRVLKEAGVSLTPGQQVGGLAKNVEDLAQRAPILGPAISAARSRGNASMNRSVALQALAPVGEKLPRALKPGYDMVRHVEERLGATYDKAVGMVDEVLPDKQFVDAMAGIGQRSTDLPEHLSGTFAKIIRDRMARIVRGDLNGKQIKAIHSELGQLQAQYGKSPGPEGLIGGMIGDARAELMALVGRQHPEAAALIKNADEGWSIYSMLNDAAANASKRAGVYTPGQLAVQARRGAARAGPNMAGKGEGRLQEFASAAQQVMPDEFGNPGTANAVGLGALGVGVMTEPASTAAVATGLTAAATPYLLMGRRVLETLPASASAAELQAAETALAGLAAKDPAVAALHREVAARLARTSGSLATTGQQ